MKTKRTAFYFGLLSVFPLLLGNSPAPFPYPTNYEDYTNTSFVKTAVPDGFHYETTITNRGDGYIVVNELRVMVKSTSRHYYDEKVTFDIIMPATTYSYSFTKDVDLDPLDLTLEVEAYTTFITDYSYSDVGAVTREPYNDHYYIYAYLATISAPTTHYYDIMTIYEYQGETYARHNRHYGATPCFFGYEEMEPSEIVIKDLVLLQGRKKNSGSGMVFILIAFMVLGIIGLGIFTLVPIVLTLLFIRAKQNKKGI